MIFETKAHRVTNKHGSVFTVQSIDTWRGGDVVVNLVDVVGTEYGIPIVAFRNNFKILKGAENGESENSLA